MKSPEAFWDGIAQKYARDPVADVPAYEATLARVRSYLGHDMDVLEIGCGTGTTALKLNDAVARYHATDVSGQMIAIATGKARAAEASNVTFFRAEADKIDGSYDLIMAFNLMHLIRDIEPVFRAIHTSLPQGGLFISKSVVIGEAGWGWKFGLMRRMIPVMQKLGKAPDVVFRQGPEWEAMIREAGFEILETGDYPKRPSNRFVVARKV